MKITKYQHSCVVAEKDDFRIVIDPGKWTTDLPDITGVVAIIITHEHGDHFSPKLVNRIQQQNPQAEVFATQTVTRQFKGSVPIKTGGRAEIDGFVIEFFGGQHAPIVDGISPCENFGVMIDDVFAYPGDSFSQPPTRPQILAVPAAAPWMKIAESIDYIRAVKPVKVFPTHNAILSPIGQDLADNWLRKVCEEIGAEYISLRPGESINV